MPDADALAIDGTPRWALGGLCEVCRGWTRGCLCRSCRRHFATVTPRCHGCGRPLPVGVPRCGDCLTEPPSYQRCVCAFDYAFPWNRMIARLKFDGAIELAPLFVDGLLQASRQAAAEPPELFVPVPLSAGRLAERGYDQAWELARRLGRALTVPADARALVRRFDSRRQTRLSRQDRQANLRDAFVVPAAKQPRIEGRHVGLVDDVLTTGATAREATAALLAGGAARVDLWVAVRTPDPSH